MNYYPVLRIMGIPNKKMKLNNDLELCSPFCVKFEKSSRKYLSARCIYNTTVMSAINMDSYYNRILSEVKACAKYKSIKIIKR